MFPSDSHSMRQMHAADMHVARQRRTQGRVVTPQERRWHRVLLDRFAQLPSRFERPDVTAQARVERRERQATASFTMIDAATGRRLGD